MHTAPWPHLAHAFQAALPTVLAQVQLALSERYPAPVGLDVVFQLFLVQQRCQFQLATSLQVARELSNMKQRVIHSLYLLPAVFLLFLWIVAAPALLEQHGVVILVAAAILSAAISTWCITLFVHAVKHNKP